MPTPARFRAALLPLILLALAPAAARADLKLPAIFTSHMLLQRGVENPIWGAADPGAKLTVKLDDKAIAVEAGGDGQWSAKLPATPAGGPHKITIEDAAGENRITLADVLFGELWVCSGQSNMEMNLGSTDHAAEDIAAADQPQIRLFTIPHLQADGPQDDCVGRWTACSPQTAGNFSATAYFFGVDVQKALKVPVGLIHTSWGGTPAEAWTRAECSRPIPV